MHKTTKPKPQPTTATIRVTQRIGHAALAMMSKRSSAKPSGKLYTRKSRTTAK